MPGIFDGHDNVKIGGHKIPIAILGVAAAGAGLFLITRGGGQTAVGAAPIDPTTGLPAGASGADATGTLAALSGELQSLSGQVAAISNTGAPTAASTTPVDPSSTPISVPSGLVRDSTGGPGGVGWTLGPGFHWTYAGGASPAAVAAQVDSAYGLSLTGHDVWAENPDFAGKTYRIAVPNAATRV